MTLHKTDIRAGLDSGDARIVGGTPFLGLLMSNAEHIVAALAWYRREQWPMLLEVSADADQLEESYDEWVTVASRQIRDLESRGIQVRKIDVEVGALTRWCQAEGRILNGAARAEYACRGL